jgi:hypothetical protein
MGWNPLAAILGGGANASVDRGPTGNAYEDTWWSDFKAGKMPRSELEKRALQMGRDKKVSPEVREEMRNALPGYKGPQTMNKSAFPVLG